MWAYAGTANVVPTPWPATRQPCCGRRRSCGAPASARPDRLLISRSLGPFTGGRLESTLLRRAEWGVYDFDDALYADERRGIHRIFGESAGWERAVRSADFVIAGSSHLAEAAAALNPSPSR